MHTLNKFKSLFFNYFGVIVVALFWVLFKSKYELEIALNFIENCLFAVILIGSSLVIKNHTLRRAYGQLAFIGFCLTLIFETLYYNLFTVFISPSTLYLLFDTNSDESLEFLQSYIGIFEVFSTSVLIAVSLFSLKRLSILYKSFGSFSLGLGIKMIVLVGLTLGYLKWSTKIIYNLPYLVVKSFTEYSKISKNLDTYQQFQKGLFEDAHSPFSEQNGGVFVLILGESTARSHMGLYGYERQTTPNLKAISNSLWTYQDVISSNAHTIESITKMLTLGNYENPNQIWEGSIIQLANAAGFETIWLSNQRPIGMNESFVTKIARSASEVKFMTTMHGRHNRILDQSMIPELETILKSSNDQPKFIIVHLAGTHMLYKHRYPEDKRVSFANSPNLKFNSESNFETVNHYDNAVIHTDFVIRSIIQSVDDLKTTSAVLYLSDHGEELFQDADFAGHNEDVATKSMYDIPFFLWQSEDYKNAKFLTFDSDCSYMTDDFFHSMAEMLQISSEAVDSTRSIFSHHFKPRTRRLQSGRDYDTFYVQNP